MAVKKAGTSVSAKKKSVEDMKKLNEKKKKMMKEESEEEEEEYTSDEGEEESETDAEEVDSDEGSEEDDDDEDDDDDDDDEDEEDEDNYESEEDLAATSKKRQKGQSQTPAKPVKTPNKTPSKHSLQASVQKNEVQSNKKTPNKKKGLIDSDTSMSTSPKKSAKADDSAVKTPSSKQQKDTSTVKGTSEKRKRENDEEAALKKPRTDAQVNASFYTVEKKQRDLRCLFVRQFPKDSTEDELKALSPDILAVRFPGRRKGRGFAFLEFASEKKAEENFSILEKAKIKGEKLYVDYVGEKSKRFTQSKNPRPENKRRIFISGLPSTATMEDIGKHFPQAMAVFMKTTGSTRFAHVDFETEAAGEEALKQNSSLTIKGQPVTVMYSFANKSNRRKPSKRKLTKEGGQRKNTAKPNQKIQKKKEEEEDDDDDDDDDDDEEDDDESDEEESDEE